MRTTWRHKAVAVTAALALGFTLTGCGASSEDDADGLQTVRLALSSPNSSSWATLAVGIEEGFFADEGIEVELQIPGGSGNVMQSMAAGRTDIGAPTPETAISAIAKGQDAKMTYLWTRGPVNAVAVEEDSPITTVDDLVGKKVGVATLASGGGVQLQSVMADLGHGKDAVELVAVDTGAAAWDALRKGRVDALSLWDTEYAGMELQGAKLRQIRPEQLDSLFSTTFVASGNFMKEHPDLVGAFGRVWAKSTVWADADPEGAIRDMWKTYPETKTSGDDTSLIAAQKKVWASRHEMVTAGDPEGTKTWGTYEESSIAAWIDFLDDAGTFTGEAPEPDEVYTNEFAEEYNDFDPAVVRALAEKR